jgi:hypothetical protein
LVKPFKRFINKKIDPRTGMVVYATVYYSNGKGSKPRPVLLVRRISDEQFDAFYFTSKPNHDDIKVEVWSEDIDGHPLTHNPSYLVLSEKVIVEVSTFYNDIGDIKENKKDEIKEKLNQIRQRKNIHVSEQEKKQEFVKSQTAKISPKQFQRPPKPPKSKP